METLITGYQFSSVNGQFIGLYEFPKNKDSETLHVPPYTTLTAPPEAPKGQAPFWVNGAWVLKADPAAQVPPVTPPESQ